MLTVDEKTNKNFTEKVYKNSKQLPIYLMLLKCKNVMKLMIAAN